MLVPAITAPASMGILTNMPAKPMTSVPAVTYGFGSRSPLPENQDLIRAQIPMCKFVTTLIGAAVEFGTVLSLFCMHG